MASRVLVVDDSPTILRVVSAILARHGYEPTVARDGLAGIETIKKPFDARALVAVIEGALTKTAEGRARPVPEGDTMPDEDTIADSVPRPSAAPKHLRARAAIEFAQQVASAIAPAVISMSEGRPTEGTVMAAIARSLTSDVLSTLAATLKDFDHEGAREVMSGDIGAIPLAEILQVLQMQRQTGVLR